MEEAAVDTEPLQRRLVLVLLVPPDLALPKYQLFPPSLSPAHTKGSLAVCYSRKE